MAFAICVGGLRAPGSPYVFAYSIARAAVLHRRFARGAWADEIECRSRCSCHRIADNQGDHHALRNFHHLGPTDITRGALPFVFAASALPAGDTVMLMLFHDAVTIALDGAHQKMVPFGPPSRFDEIFTNPKAQVMVCKPCAEIRGIMENMLVKNATFGGMNDLHAHASRADAKLVNF